MGAPFVSSIEQWRFEYAFRQSVLHLRTAAYEVLNLRVERLECCRLLTLTRQCWLVLSASFFKRPNTL